MNSKLTRRELAAAAVAAAQAPPPSEDLLQQAREQVRKNADQLTRREVSISTEPAFVFKA